MKMEDIVFNLYKDNIITCKAFREEVRFYKNHKILLKK